MATSRLNGFLRHLGTAALLRQAEGVPDAHLLGLFVERRDEAAFEALVRRHGPMVWGVCRRTLRSAHDAEDAFQATFLVLVRKAPSVAPRALVGNWLYGVACRTAAKARATAMKRQAKEKLVEVLPEPEPVGRDLGDDLRRLLDQELERLPDAYRAAVVLCDLEGRTHKEAARQLGWPVGTLSTRLTRARVLLAKRLARHGLAVSAGSLAAALAQSVASAGVPNSVVSSTIQAASLFAAGQAAAGLISIKVAALTDGVLKAMLLTKLKAATAALLLAAGIMGAGLSGTGLIYRTQAAEPTEAQAAGRAEPAGAREAGWVADVRLEELEEAVARQKEAEAQLKLAQVQAEQAQVQLEQARAAYELAKARAQQTGRAAPGKPKADPTKDEARPDPLEVQRQRAAAESQRRRAVLNQAVAEVCMTVERLLNDLSQKAGDQRVSLEALEEIEKAVKALKEAKVRQQQQKKEDWQADRDALQKALVEQHAREDRLRLELDTLRKELDRLRARLNALEQPNRRP